MVVGIGNVNIKIGINQNGNDKNHKGGNDMIYPLRE